MKKCYVHLDVKNELKVEEHDDLNDKIYNDDVSQFVFLLFEIINSRMQLLSVNFESLIEKLSFKMAKAHADEENNACNCNSLN